MPVQLVDDNFVIRAAGAGDSETLAAWWNDGAIMAHAGYPLGLSTSPRIVLEQLLHDDDEVHRRLILEIDRVPVGEMNYRNKGGGTVEIGIKLCVIPLQNKGYGTRFLRLLITWLFTEKGYKKIILDTNVNNMRAQHVYEKLGFKRVGTRMNSFTDQLGQAQSSIDYTLTPADFYSS